MKRKILKAGVTTTTTGLFRIPKSESYFFRQSNFTIRVENYKTTLSFQREQKNNLIKQNNMLSHTILSTFSFYLGTSSIHNCFEDPLSYTRKADAFIKSIKLFLLKTLPNFCSLQIAQILTGQDPTKCKTLPVPLSALHDTLYWLQREHCLRY